MGLCSNKGRCRRGEIHPRASERWFGRVLHTAKCFLHFLRQVSYVFPTLLRNKKARIGEEKLTSSVMTLVSDTAKMSKSSNPARVSSNGTPCVISRSRSDTCYCIPSKTVVESLPRRGSDWTDTIRHKESEAGEVQNILRPLQFNHASYPDEKTALFNRRYSGLYSKISPFANCPASTTTTTKSTREVGRSQSMKTRKSNEARQRNRGSSIPSEATQNCTGTKVKQRTVSNRSLPLPGDEADYMRLRNFSVTSKGVINRGDSFRSKSSHNVPAQINGEQQAVQKSETPSAQTPSAEFFKALLVGATNVGKTALKNQFRTSEYRSAYDSVHDDELDKAVAVVLNSEESEIAFEEWTFPEGNGTAESLSSDHDAYVLIYSVADRWSYLQAKHFLSQIESKLDSRAVILVGNKTDLARLRAVTTEEGKSLAKERGCKFIETSAAINHQIDELLVGTLAQIRMKKAKMADKHKKKKDSMRRGSNCPGSKASGVLKKILRRACLKSKSCDNLHVL